jgi:hypothetical protein
MTGLAVCLIKVAHAVTYDSVCASSARMMRFHWQNMGVSAAELIAGCTRRISIISPVQVEAACLSCRRGQAAERMREHSSVRPSSRPADGV